MTDPNKPAQPDESKNSDLDERPKTIAKLGLVSAIVGLVTVLIGVPLAIMKLYSDAHNTNVAPATIPATQLSTTPVVPFKTSTMTSPAISPVTTNRATGTSGPPVVGLQAQADTNEGHQLIDPHGRVDLLTNGQRWHVPNPAVRDCIVKWSAAGNPIPLTDTEFYKYPDSGKLAHCPFENVGYNFATSDGTLIWRVFADGTRQHVSENCADDPNSTSIEKKYQAVRVTQDELAGHTWDGSAWSPGPNKENCAALPG